MKQEKDTLITLAAYTPMILMKYVGKMMLRSDIMLKEEPQTRLQSDGRIDAFWTSTESASQLGGHRMLIERGMHERNSDKKSPTGSGLCIGWKANGGSVCDIFIIIVPKEVGGIWQINPITVKFLQTLSVSFHDEMIDQAAREKVSRKINVMFRDGDIDAAPGHALKVIKIFKGCENFVIPTDTSHPGA